MGPAGWRLRVLGVAFLTFSAGRGFEAFLLLGDVTGAVAMISGAIFWTGFSCARDPFGLLWAVVVYIPAAVRNRWRYHVRA